MGSVKKAAAGCVITKLIPAYSPTLIQQYEKFWPDDKTGTLASCEDATAQDPCQDQMCLALGYLQTTRLSIPRTRMDSWAFPCESKNSWFPSPSLGRTNSHPSSVVQALGLRFQVCTYSCPQYFAHLQPHVCATWESLVRGHICRSIQRGLQLWENMS